MSTPSLQAQLHTAAETHIQNLKSQLDHDIAACANHIDAAEQLTAALTSRGIEAEAIAALYGDIISIWVKVKGATVPDIEEALARSDIRTTGVYPGIQETEVRTQPYAEVAIFIAHTDIPHPAL